MKSRQENSQGINDLLEYLLPVVEKATKHPDTWVCDRLIYWATYPGTLESQTKHWTLSTPQKAALATAFQKLVR